MAKEIQEFLHLSEEELSRAIEDAPLPMILQAEDGQVLRISRSWTELTGYTLSDIPTFDNWVTKLVCDGADKVRDYVHGLFKGSKSMINVEFDVHSHNNEIRYWSFSASSPGTLLDGRRFIVGMAIDITERKKAQDALMRSEKRYRELFDSLSEGFVVIEMIYENEKPVDFRFLEVNASYARLIGKTVDQILGKTSREAIGILKDYWYQLYDDVIKTGKSARYENYINALDEYHEVVAWKTAPNQIAILYYNTTERKRLEKQLQNYTTNLEKIVKALTQQLREKERLAAVGETAGMVGHDLRNPLQAIVSELYLAKSELHTVPEGEKKNQMVQALDSIFEQVNYMDKIVSDLQTFVKPVEPIMQIVKLKPLITALVAQQTIPQNVQTLIQVPEAITITADPQLLKRVLINLVTNAVQAMPEGGELSITARSNSAGQVQIVVEDTGEGIPDEVKPKIFTPLFTTKSKGQGFGLAVCKRVIEAMRGTISFESQQGKGTKFLISLPKSSN